MHKKALNYRLQRRACVLCEDKKKKTKKHNSENCCALSKISDFSQLATNSKHTRYNMSNANSEEAFNIRIDYAKPETVEFAKNELRETPEVKEAAIKELRELLHADTDINYKDDDEFLVIFLRACHFYPQSALEKVGQLKNRKSLRTVRWR